MGRKRKNQDASPSTGYFNEREENAFKAYMLEEDEIEKEKIYNNFLREPFVKLIKGIMTRYQLWSKSMSVEEYTIEMLGFLHTKLKGFKPESGKKAYSYFGTIARNEMLSNQKKDRKQNIQYAHFDTVQHELEEDERFAYEIEFEVTELSDEMLGFRQFLEEEMSFPFKLGREMTKNEYLVCNAIISLSNKTNIIEELKGKREVKNFCMLALKEETNLKHEDMLKALKTFRQLFFMYKRSY